MIHRDVHASDLRHPLADLLDQTRVPEALVVVGLVRREAADLVDEARADDEVA